MTTQRNLSDTYASIRYGIRFEAPDIYGINRPETVRGLLRYFRIWRAMRRTVKAREQIRRNVTTGEA